jgi:hypothetical protein
MTWAHGEPAVAKLRQNLADRAFMQHDAEASFQLVAQIHTPPAHHPVPSRIGTRLDQFGQFGLLVRGEFWLWAWRLAIVQASAVIFVGAERKPIDHHSANMAEISQLRLLTLSPFHPAAGSDVVGFLL